MGVGAYGAKWTSGYGALPVDSAGKLTMAGMIWGKGLGPFTREHVLSTMSNYIAGPDEWPPTLPGLRRRCFAIPELAALKREFAPGTGERSAFARLVWSFLDAYRFTRAESDTADRMLRDAYELAVEHRMRGGALPEPAAAIEHVEPERKPASPEVAAAHLADLKQRFGLSDPEAVEMAGAGDGP